GLVILASAGTVIFSLLALTVAELQSTKSMGLVFVIGVGVVLISMMTLLSVLLVIFGRWIFWPVKPTYGTAELISKGFWARVGARIAVRPRVTWIAIAVVFGALVLGSLGLKASGLTNVESFR